MDEEELLLQGDDGAAVITDHLDEDQLLGESVNGDGGSVFGESVGAVCKVESLDHEELDYEEEEEKEERESRFTSERGKKSPVRAPEDAAAAAAAAKPNENTGVAGRGSYRGRVMRGGAGFRGGMGMGGNFNMRGGMRMVAGGGSVGPISLLTSNIPPPMMMPGPGMGGPMGNILVNPNFPVGAGLTLLPTPGPGGYGAPPMGIRGPMMPPAALGPKVTLSIDGAPALAVPVNMSRAQPPQMGPGPGAPMSMPPPNMSMRPGGPPLVLNAMVGPPPSAMRFPPGMGPPPMNGGMNVPPPGMATQMAGAVQGNWNLMVEAFLGNKNAVGGDRSKKKRRRRSRSSSYSSSSDSESSYSDTSRSRSRSRSPRRSRKRSSRGTRKHEKKRSGGGSKGERGGERRVFRTGPNSYRINSAPSNGSELPSLLDGIDRGSSSSNSKARRVDRERQRENDSRDSARALGLDDDYLSRVEEQRRQREDLRRRKERSDGTTAPAAANRESVHDRRRAPTTGRSRTEGTGSSARDTRDSRETRKSAEAVDDSKRKAYLAVHVKNVGNLGEAALGRVKALANEVGETKKVWRSADDVVTVIFVELDKAKAFMLKYNGKVLSGTRVTVGLEKVYLNLSDVHDR